MSDYYDDEQELAIPHGVPPWYGEHGTHLRPPAATSNPYVRFGDTRRINFGALQSNLVAEFQRVTLPRPAQCRVFFHVEVMPTGLTPSVEFTALYTTIGVGSSSTQVRRVYLAQPQVPSTLQPLGTALDVQWDAPIENLYARVEGRAVNCLILFTLGLAPYALEDIRQ